MVRAIQFLDLSTSEAKAVTARQPSWKTIRAEEHEPLTHPVGRSVELTGKPPSRALSIFESRKIDIGFSRKFDRCWPASYANSCFSLGVLQR
jgi:hypothetical protein